MASRHVSLPCIVMLLCAGCGDDGGPSATDTATDPGAEDTFDPCTRYPNACNLDPRNPHAPYDCCTSSTTCCALCHDSSMCELEYECRDTCPETLPCTGVTGTGGFSCYYDPDEFTGTAYCPVPAGTPPDDAVACTAECATSIECAFAADPWGDAALCCPDSTSCTTSAFDLPRCE